ncbi:uncharacterized protein LOC122304827 [Carya illinoinensis]|uniref:uncharacterized protein LOC122304827 n=1 Tax=Carya illinoinensis TaxID=32201 RepID=UPI001C71C6C8|nr:uncharacterized protein LOC122304827 [Carya illinoinensis]
MEGFRLATNDCGLSDLGFKRDRFTWCNNQEGTQFTKERLDRSFCNLAWHELFPNTVVSTKGAQCSDHRPILITVATGSKWIAKGERPFRYEAKWAEREECFKVVKESWVNLAMNPNRLERTTEHLSRCRNPFKAWSKASFRQAKKIIEAKLKQISDIQKLNKGDLSHRINLLQFEVESNLEIYNLELCIQCIEVLYLRDHEPMHTIEKRLI